MTERVESAACKLSGLTLEDGWEVLNRVELKSDHSGSTFSVGYLARNASGHMGYVKAFDYQSAMEDDDPPRELERLAASYNAERDLLALCGLRRLGRVVRALAAGTVKIPDTAPGAVSYLILELADGDAREALVDHDPGEHAPMLKLAHDAAVAMEQLHSIGVVHQDVKPSNLLVWNKGDRGPSGKLGDLGLAHMDGRPAPHDDLLIPGDCSYAAPEQLYRAPATTGDRLAADMHMLGNLVCFLLIGVSYNALLFRDLDRSQHWLRWGGTFDEVLPALVDAHGLALKHLHAVLNSEIRDGVVKIVNELCYPDPTRRGDPVARRLGVYPFKLRRFVARLDLQRRHAALATSGTV